MVLETGTGCTDRFGICERGECGLCRSFRWYEGDRGYGSLSGTYHIKDTGLDGVIIFDAHNVTLNGNNTVLIGDGKGIGITNDGHDVVRIKNCTIKGYDRGIYLAGGIYHQLLYNVVEDCKIGIFFDSAARTDASGNTVRYCLYDGIYLNQASSTNLTGNEACANIEWDIKSYGGNNNEGSKNRCNVTEDWHDSGVAQGCQYTCTACKDWDADGICDDTDNCRFDDNNDQSDVDNDKIGDVCDNCKTTYNPDQKDTDYEGIGDVCDNCWEEDNKDQADPDLDCDILKKDPAFWNGTQWLKDPHCAGLCDNCPEKSNPYQADKDGDHRGDACDNCGSVSNPYQEDVNNDGKGDACDCWDIVAGSSESGIDCGGVCGACHAKPAGWQNVTALRIKGEPNKGFIDVVFIPATDYQGNMPEFRKDISELVRTRFFTLDQEVQESIPSDYKDRFNFYLYTGGEGYRTDRWYLPARFEPDAPGYDFAIIIKNSTCCVGEVWGSTYPHWGHALGKNGALTLHESGHGIWELKDEYCGDTNYNMFKDLTVTNIWTSLSACQAEAASQQWSGGSCQQIQSDDPTTAANPDCQKNYWRYDPDECLMADGGSFFNASCSRKIHYVFDNWPSGKTKGVLLRLHIRDDTITFSDAEVVAGHPDLVSDNEAMRGESYSSSGELIDHFGISDPRLSIGDEAVLDENGEIIGYKGFQNFYDDMDFTVIMPFSDNLKYITIRNGSSGKELVTVNLTLTLHDYCRNTGFESLECRNLDLDNDRIPDYRDSNPLEKDATTPLDPLIVLVACTVACGCSLLMTKRRKG
jgi:parallel beta-helix repeat protein